MKRYNLLENNRFQLLVIIIIALLFTTIKLHAQDAEIDSVFKAGLEHHKKGMNLLTLGERKGGLKELDLASNDFKDHIYELQRSVDSLITVYSKLQSEEPKSPVYFYVLGILDYFKRREDGYLQKAREKFEKALSLYPDYAAGYSGLVTLAYFDQKEDEVIRLYRKMLEIDPERLPVMWSICSLLDKKGEKEEARQIRNKAISIDSSSIYSIRCLYDLSQLEKTAQAKISYYDKILRLNKDKDELQGFIQRILIYSQRESPEYAENLAEKIMADKLGGNDRFNRMRAIETLSALYPRLHRDKYDQFAERALKEDNPRVLLETGRFYSDSLNNKKEALKYFLKAYEITSAKTVRDVIAFTSMKNPWEYLEKTANDFKYNSISLVLGKTYYELKEYDNAEKYLRESIPGNIKSKFNYPLIYLGYTLSGKGQKEEAIEWLAKGIAMKSDPDAEKKLKELVSGLNLSVTAEELIVKARMKEAKPAKDFTLKDIEGNVVQLSKLKGKVVMLDFWGTWCGPCVSELPQLVKLYEKYKGNPNVVFYSVDVNEQPPVIKKFMKEKGYSFNVLIADATNTQKDYEVTAVPTKFLIDKEGKIQFSHIGANPKEDAVEALSKELDELLKN